MVNINIDSDVFNDVYLPYMEDYSHRWEVIYGGAGSGKSVYVGQKLVLKALKSKRTILVVRKTLTSQRNSCWKLLTDILDDWQLSKYAKINKSEYRIELTNGSIFYIAGIDNPERIKSIVGVTDIWCEEATELNPEDFDQLNLRMRANVEQSQVYVSFNPISKVNWVYKRWFANSLVDEDTFILRTTYKDNKFLPPDYIQSLERMINTNPAYYKVYALGEFTALDKLVYPLFTIGEPPDNCNQLELLCGLDWGYTNDPTAFIASYKDEENKKLYIFDEYYKSGMLNGDIADMLKYKGFAKSVIIADSAEPKSIDELKQNGITRIKPAVKGKDSILSGIQKVQQYELIVSNKCTNTIIELENYAWQKDKQTGEYINEPMDSYNHILDALRYSIQTSNGKIRTISKDVLGL